jgi:hypothetical protein
MITSLQAFVLCRGEKFFIRSLMWLRIVVSILIGICSAAYAAAVEFHQAERVLGLVYFFAYWLATFGTVGIAISSEALRFCKNRASSRKVSLPHLDPHKRFRWIT